MATTFISLIQHRYGHSTELPDSLEHGEIGLVEDMGELVIGVPNNPLVVDRQQAVNNIYPYQNIRILTEFSNLGDYFKHKPTLSIENPLNMAFILIGDDEVMSITSGSVLTINGVDILLTGVGTTLDDTIVAINNEGIVGIHAFNSGGKFGLINSSGNDLILVNHTHSPLLDLKVSANSTESYPNIGMFSRKISEVLDDSISIKSFGANGKTSQNALPIINSSLISLYGDGSSILKHKDLKFPSGMYMVEGGSIGLIQNLIISGEGIDRSYIVGDSEFLLDVVDTYGYNRESPNFGDGNLPDNILIRDMTFEMLNDEILFGLSNMTNVTFERCKFRGNYDIDNILVSSLASNITVENITFKSCIFEMGEYGINITHSINGLTIQDCIFKDIMKEAIYIEGNGVTNPKNINILDNKFINVADSSVSPLYIGVNVSDVNIQNNEYIDVISPLKSIIKGINVVSDIEEVVTNIAPTFEPDVFELDIEDKSMFIEYIIYGVGHNRKGILSFFVDSTIPDTNPILSRDNDFDADAIFSVRRTTNGFAVSLLNSGSENINIKFTYRIF